MTNPAPANSSTGDSATNSRPRVAFIMAQHALDYVYGDECQAAIAAISTPVHPPITTAALDQPCPWLENVEVLFTGWGAPRLDERLLARMPRLRIVFHGAGSVRNMVSDAFWARGIRVVAVAAINAIPVADYTLAAILFGLKSAWTLARETRVQRRYPPITRRMAVRGNYRATVGLVSFGLIGRLVRKRLEPFDLDVIVYDPFVSADDFAAARVKPAELKDVFAQADVVSVHAPALPTTRGMVTGALLEALKPGATFINTARGMVVREDELIAVLTRRPDLHAVLDVTDPEPPTATSPLYTLPNVFLTPHIAGSLGSECRRLGHAIVAELERFLQGKPLEFELTREQAELQT